VAPRGGPPRAPRAVPGATRHRRGVADEGGPPDQPVGAEGAPAGRRQCPPPQGLWPDRRGRPAPILLAWNWYGLSQKRARIADLTSEKEELEEKWKLSAQDRLDVDALKEWEETTVSWLDELYDVAARMPHEKGLRLTQVAGVPISKRTAKDKYVARMTLHGLTTGDQDILVTQFLEAAHKDPHLRPAPANFRGQEFTVKIDIAAQPPTKYTTPLRVPPGARRPQADAEETVVEEPQTAQPRGEEQIP